jgi:hypothetical protein
MGENMKPENDSEIQITVVESPYGDRGAVYEGALGMMNHFLLQLKSFRGQNRTEEEREFLEADIRGYEEILKSNSQKNAREFIHIKHEERIKGITSFPTNEAIVNHLKATGVWES